MNGPDYSPPAFREVIPHGACVPGSGKEDTVRTFKMLDEGISDPVKLEVAAYVAQAACQPCPQFEEYCLPQKDAIAEELWSRGGGAVVVGGQTLVRLRQAEHARRIHESALSFDLSRMPEDDPPRYLLLLRQAVRAGQLKLRGAPSAPVRQAERQFLENSQNLSNQARSAISNLGLELASDIARNAAMLLLQVSVFGRTSKGAPVAAPQGRIDSPLHQRLYEQCLDEATILRAYGFMYVQNIVFYHSVEFYRNLYERYVGTHAPKSRFFEMVRRNAVDPEKAILAYVSRYDLIADYCAEHGIVMLPTRRQQIALSEQATDNFLSGQPEDPAPRPQRPPSPPPPKKRQPVRQQPPPQTQPPSFTPPNPSPPSTVPPLTFLAPEEVSAEQPAAQPVVAPPGPVDRFDEYHQQLRQLYADVPGATPYFLQECAHRGRLKETFDEVRFLVEACVATLARMKQLKLEAQDEMVPESYLQGLAQRRHHFVTWETIQAEYLVDKVDARLRARARYAKDRQAQHLEKWAIRRALENCGIEGVEATCDAAYSFMNYHSFLVQGQGGLPQLQDVWVTEIARKVCDPKSGSRISFKPVADQLSPLERLALAEIQKFAPLVYGVRIDQTALCLGLGTDDLATYVYDQVVPKALGLVQDSSAGTGSIEPPLTLERLGEDIRIMHQYSQVPEKEVMHTTSNSVLSVVGAAAVPTQYLADPELFAQLPPSHDQFVREAIASGIPPARQAQVAVSLARALTWKVVELGVVELADGSSGLGLQLVQPLRVLPPLERCVVASLVGIAPLLYQSDTSIVLKNVFGSGERLEQFWLEKVYPRVRGIIGGAASELGALTRRALEAEVSASSVNTAPEKVSEASESRGGSAPAVSGYQPASSAKTPQTPARRHERVPNPFERLALSVGRLIELDNTAHPELTRESIISHFKPGHTALTPSEQVLLTKFLSRIREDYVEWVGSLRGQGIRPPRPETQAMVSALLGKSGVVPILPRPFARSVEIIERHFQASYERGSVAAAVAGVLEAVGLFKERKRLN